MITHDDPTTIGNAICPPTPQVESRANARSHYRAHMERIVTNPKEYPVKQANPDFRFKEPLKRGWLLPYLTGLDDLCWGRWDHWTETMLAGRVLADPIPQITFNSHGPLPTIARKSLENALNSIERYGHWQSWGSFRNFDYLLDWMLFGFGYGGQKTEPEPPVEGASERLYQTLDLGPMILAPNDYTGDLLAENNHGRHLGFFPTPMEICQLLTSMNFADATEAAVAAGADPRTQTVQDPCVGTGRMLLAASNHSYRLFAQDISQTMVKSTIVNLYLYAPWGAKPFPFLDRQESRATRAAVGTADALSSPLVAIPCPERPLTVATMPVAPHFDEAFAAIVKEASTPSPARTPAPTKSVPPRSPRTSTPVEMPQQQSLLLEELANA